jgi:hypothetical protein
VEQNVIMCCFSDFNQRDSNIAKNMWEIYFCVFVI